MTMLKLDQKLIIILIITIAAILNGCMDDWDDIKSDNRILIEDVWDDPAALNGVLANMYYRMIIEDFSYYVASDDYLEMGNYSWRSMDMHTMSDEGTAGFQKTPAFDQYGATFEYPDDYLSKYLTIDGGGNGQRGENNMRQVYNEAYFNIRNCHDFINNLPNAPLEEEEKEVLMAEVRLLRAWNYFTLVKRFGGVPLITESMDHTEGIERLQVPRAKEEDIYRFIIEDCQYAADKLPVTRTTNVYRFTKGAAQALCSRAALYAGSIAKYGTVQLDGLVGIDPSKAEEFYQIAYDVANDLINNGPYTLYNSNPDKTENYRELFFTPNNGEYIFEKHYNIAAEWGHSYEKKHLPYFYCRWGSVGPNLEMVESYDYLDGSTGIMKIDNNEQYDTRYEAFQGKDPRFLASVFVSGTPLFGTKVEFQRGVINTEGETVLAQNVTGASYEKEIYNDPSGREYVLTGKDGGTYAGDATKTGFYIRKFIRDDLTDEQKLRFGNSELPYPIFRLGEIYLNLAEAAVEMGMYQGEAYNAVKTIRDRAGVETPFSVLDIDRLRRERKVELAFEGLRMWDIKRWRLAHLDAEKDENGLHNGGLNGFRGTGMHPYFDLRTDKWVFERADDIPKRMRIFTERNYYARFDDEVISANPKIIQNPGY